MQVATDKQTVLTHLPFSSSSCARSFSSCGSGVEGWTMFSEIPGGVRCQELQQQRKVEGKKMGGGQWQRSRASKDERGPGSSFGGLWVAALAWLQSCPPPVLLPALVSVTGGDSLASTLLPHTPVLWSPQGRGKWHFCIGERLPPRPKGEPGSAMHLCLHG